MWNLLKNKIIDKYNDIMYTNICKERKENHEYNQKRISGKNMCGTENISREKT
jgi:hypothetical protein